MFKTAILWSFVAVCVLTPINCIDFSVKGDKCSTLDLCSGTRVNAFRTCSCDEDCNKYATCCVDSENYQVPSDEQEYQCYSDRTVHTPVFAKRTCADKFPAHESHRIACMEEEPDKIDILGNLLVSSSKTMITYWNKECAICNNEQKSDIAAWTVQVTCPRSHDGKQVTFYLIKRNLTFEWSLERWGVMVGGDFVKCSISTFQPSWATGKLKYCAPNMIATCPPNHTDTEVVKRCSLYHGERKLKYKDVYYKNVHCAICNGVSLKELDCVGRNYAPLPLNKGEKGEYVKAVFEDKEWVQILGSERYRCSENFGYDPFWAKCRRVERFQEQQTAHEENSAQTVTGKLSILFSIFIAIKILL